MPEFNINANIAEIDGADYPVHLNWLPRVGELIDLSSFMDQRTERGTRAVAHRYEVVQIAHQLHDVSDVAQDRHFVTVFVRLSKGELFAASETRAAEAIQ